MPDSSAVLSFESKGTSATTYNGSDALCTILTSHATSEHAFNVPFTKNRPDMEVFPAYREVTSQINGTSIDSPNGIATSEHSFSNPVLRQKDNSDKHEPVTIKSSSSLKQSTPPLNLSRPFSSSELLSDYRSRASTDEIVENVSKRLPKSENIAFEVDESSNESNNEERVFYRSWREGGHVLGPLSGRLNARRSSDDYEIDKKIEATLPSSEPTYHPRSRKASLYLRLFKDNDGLRDDSLGSERSGVLDSEHKGLALPITGRSEQIETNQYATCRATSGLVYHAQELGEDGAGRRNSKERAYDGGVGEDAAVAYESAALLPTSSTAKPESQGKTFRAWNSSELDAEMSMEPDRKSLIKINKLHESLAISSRNGRGPDMEHKKSEPIAVGGDMEKEHISSALYFPHRSSSLIDEEENREAVDSARVSSPSPNSVEISLQAKDESQVLHGDIPSSRRSASLEQHLDVESDLGSDFKSEPQEPKIQLERPYQEGRSSLTVQRNYVSADKKQPNAPPTAGLNGRLDDVPPLAAVELKPYDHQVGGHSTVYRFSRRAVCKQLNNRENEFYETIERTHAELLRFLPR